MTQDVSSDHGAGMAPLDDEVDHVRGGTAEIHPYALAASQVAEAAALQHRFWEMHALLFHHQQALDEADLRGYAAQLGLDVTRFDADRASAGVLERIRRDVESGLATGEVRGTPTLFLDGVVHRGSYDAATLLQEVTDS